MNIIMETFLTDILSDISNFALVIFGFCATLYTVIYSFILNKKDLLKELSESLKVGVKVISHTQKEQNYIHYIRKMRSFNKYIILCLWFSLFLYLFSLITKYFKLYNFKIEILGNSFEGFLVYILLFLTIGLFITIGILIKKSISTYDKTTKI